MFVELLVLAVGNLTRARARLLMTAGGVLVGTAAVVLLVAITLGLQTAAEAGFGSSAALTEVRVYPNWSNYNPEDGPPTISGLDLEAMAAIEGVSMVIPMLQMQSGGELIAGDLRNYGQIVGIDPAALPILGLAVREGTPSLEDGQVVFGGSIPRFFVDPTATEWEPQEVDVMNTDLGLKLYSWAAATERTIDLNVSAVLEEGTSFDGSILMPIAEVVRWNEWASGQRIPPDKQGYDMVIVRTQGRNVTDAVTQAVRDLGFQPDGMGDFLKQLNGFFVTMRLTLGGIGGVALLVAAFGVANTMTMAILERTKEIGLMKAIGARDRDVLTVFLVEAGLVGLCGGVAGLAVSLLVQHGVNQRLQAMTIGQEGAVTFLPVDLNQLQSSGELIVIPPLLMAFAIALAVSVGLAAGVLPALRAARMVPVMALRQE